MADYTQITSFAPKDALTTGDPNKKIRGSQLDPEFAAIATAIQSKYDSVDIASNAEAAALTGDSKLITPGKLAHALQNGSVTLGANILLNGGIAASDIVTNDTLRILTPAYKSANTSRSSTTTPAVDPHLSISLEANEVYKFQLFFRHTTGGGDLKYNFTVPSGATLRAVYEGWDNAAPSASTRNYITESSTFNTLLGPDALGRIAGYVITSASAGTLAFNWAQAFSDASSTTLYTGSWLTVERVS